MQPDGLSISFRCYGRGVPVSATGLFQLGNTQFAFRIGRNSTCCLDPRPSSSGAAYGHFGDSFSMEPSPKRKRFRSGSPPGGSSQSTYFPVKKPDEYSSDLPSWSPTEIGSFSVDGDRFFHHDQRYMKYLVMPSSTSSVNFDLNKGYKNVVPNNQSTTEKMELFLRWILANKSAVTGVSSQSNDADNQRVPPDFVSNRHLLTTLVCTVYDHINGWEICATKFRGTIYLYQSRGDENWADEERKKIFWGFKFEQYMTASKKDGIPDVETPVNGNEAFCIAMKGKLGENSILFSAEVDAVDTTSDTSPETRQYVELKSCRLNSDEKKEMNFYRNKLRRCWAQSYLAGIRKAIYGFTDDKGIVQSVETFLTEEMPEKAKLWLITYGSKKSSSGQDQENRENVSKFQSHVALIPQPQLEEKLSGGKKIWWSPAVALNFCNEFLQYVKTTVDKDNPCVVYKFCWQPRQDITCEVLSPAGDFQILPKWFINSLSSQ